MIFSNSVKAFALNALNFAEHPILMPGTSLESKDTAGCGKPHTVDGISKDFEVSTDGRNRTYRIHLPSIYDANTPAPLVISYHGHGKDMVEQETLSQFSNDAINPTMIAVYPQGLKGVVSTALFHSPLNISHRASLTTSSERQTILGRRIRPSAQRQRQALHKRLDNPPRSQLLHRHLPNLRQRHVRRRRLRQHFSLLTRSRRPIRSFCTRIRRFLHGHPLQRLQTLSVASSHS